MLPSLSYITLDLEDGRVLREQGVIANVFYHIVIPAAVSLRCPCSANLAACRGTVLVVWYRYLMSRLPRLAVWLFV